MAAQSSGKVYVQVVRITHRYLGPAADRFIARQIQNHLHIEPADLSAADLEKLIDWVRVAISLITEDGEIIDEYIERLEQLIANDRKHAV